LTTLLAAAEAGSWPADADPLAALDAALSEGAPAVRALELARHLVARRPDDSALRLGVAERLSARMDFAGARALLAPLEAHPRPEQRLRACFLLAEAAELEGDLEAARRRYELVLAEDLDYPNARARAARLAARAGRAAREAPALLAPTILAVESSGTRASRFRLLAELGRGSAATVYRARDEELGREVALKILHPQFYGDAHAAARAAFFAEARIAASLRHPGIVAVYDVDEALKLIAMEHLTGATLRERLRRGPLDPAAAVARMIELLGVLRTVHQQGVVHRDLKPGNLLFRGHPDAAGSALVLSDFGAAHLLAAAPAPAAGTLLYMAPEQRRGALASPRHDLYSAGAIFYEMLVGAPPFSPADLLRDARPEVGLPDSLSALLPRAAQGPIAELLRGCLALDPAARFDDAGALAAARAAADALSVSDADFTAWERALEAARAAKT